MDDLLKAMERPMSLISSAMTIGVVIIAVFNTHRSPLEDGFFVLAAGACLAVLFITVAVKYNERAIRGKNVSPISLGSIEISDERTSGPRNWPMKVRVKLHNDSSQPLEVGPADWIATSQQAQLHLHPTGGIGWSFVVGGVEGRKVIVPANSIFDIWWGLNSTYEPNELREKIAHHQLGTLVIPAKMGGKQTENRFSL